MAEYPSVRRRLFQDEDSPEPESGEGENITNSLLEQMKMQAEEARSRWNFDFEKEEPLPGRWEWVRKGEQRFETFGEDDTEVYYLANDQLDNSNHADHHSDHSNDVFVDASNVNMPGDVETATEHPKQTLENNNSDCCDQNR